jgi:hypothetical protein
VRIEAGKRLRELGPERLLLERNKPGPGGNCLLLLTPLELLDRLAALVPPRVHRHRYGGVLPRMAAHRIFAAHSQTTGSGRLCLGLFDTCPRDVTALRMAPN